MKIPTSWADITIGKYYEYFTLVNSFKNLDALDLEIKIIALLCDITEDKVAKEEETSNN